MEHNRTTPTNESGIASAAAGTGTWFASMSGTSARVLLLVKVAFKSPGAAVCRQNTKCQGGKEINRTAERKVRGYRLQSRGVVHFEIKPDIVRDVRQSTKSRTVSIAQRGK